MSGTMRNTARLTASDLASMQPAARKPIGQLLADTDPMSHREAIAHATDLAEQCGRPWPLEWLAARRHTLPDQDYLDLMETARNYRKP